VEASVTNPLLKSPAPAISDLLHISYQCAQISPQPCTKPDFDTDTDTDTDPDHDPDPTAGRVLAHTCSEP
jgi:hypothetical protein